MQESRQDQNKNKAASFPIPIGLFDSAVVYISPIFSSLLVGAILLILANFAFDQEALGGLLNSVKWPFGLIVHALLIILTFVLIILFLITPALTAFLVNLKRPVLTSWSKAILNGFMFFIFCTLVISIANFNLKPLDTHHTPDELTYYKLLLSNAFLFSTLLSLSVIIFGHLGSSRGLKRNERRLNDS